MMNKLDSHKTFFKGLNELRSIAAIAVLIHHIELFKFRDQIGGSLYEYVSFQYFIDKLGKNGVYLFFVLSGFLITFLLLQEFRNHGYLDFKKFFLRRILRIWPLYFIILALSFLLIPCLQNHFSIFSLSENYSARILNKDNYSIISILLYTLFLSNYALNEGMVVVGASQSWSVSLEEQFYLIWPFLIHYFRKRKLLLIFVGIILLYCLCKLFVRSSLFSMILKVFSFEFMAIGGLAGYLYFFYKDQISKFFKGNLITYFSILGVIGFLMFFKLFNTVLVQDILLALFFAVFILNTVALDKDTWFTNRFLNWLGKISYGIYMYHPLVMFLIFPFAEMYFGHSYLFHLLVFVSITSITVALSAISYNFVEARLIRLKDRKFSR